MIFRTITNESTGATKSIGLFGKSLCELKEIISTIKLQGLINTIFNKSSINEDAIIRYNNAIIEATVNGATLAEKQQIMQSSMENTNKATAQLIGSTKGAIVETKALAAAQNASTLKARAQAVALKAVSIAGNMILFTFISKGLEFVVKGFDNWIHRVEKARERTNELFGEFNQMNDTLAEHKKTVSELAGRYDDLSKGVNLSDNHNISLSADEYKEFLDINKRLADSFPELANGIDENGNSILSLGTKGITAKEQLEQLLQTEEDLNNFQIAQGLEESFRGVFTYIEEANNATDKFNDSIDDTNEAMSKIQNISRNGITLGDGDSQPIFSGNTNNNQADISYMHALIDSVNEFWDSLDDTRYNQLYDMGIVDGTSLLRFDEDYVNGVFDVYSQVYCLTPEEISTLEDIIQRNISIVSGELLDSINAESQSLQGKIQQGKNAWTDFLPALVSSMKSKQTFKSLDADLQDIAIHIVEGLDYSCSTAMNEYNPDPYAFIRDKLIVPMGSLGDSDKAKLTSAFNELFKLDVNDISQSNQEEITELIDDIATILGKNPVELRIALGFNTEEIQNRYHTALREAKRQLGGYNLDRKGNEISNDIGENLDDFWDENVKTEDDLVLWKKATDGITDVTEAMDAYTEAKKNNNDIKNDSTLPSLSNTITQLNTQLKPAFDALQSAYSDIFTSGSFTLENVDISMLDSMKSKLDDLNAIDGISIDYSSFENLARVLTDTSSTADDVQAAFNLLATDIVTGLNPALSDCSGENYRLVQSLLESTGITNAEAVMVSSLGYTYEDYAAAKKECADAGIDLTDKTEQEIEKLTWQQIATETCGQALALLQLKKALCNETALTPGSDINSLYQLAKAAGIATEKIAMLAGLNAAYEKESAAGHTQAALAIANRMEEVKADVEKQFSEIGNVEVDFSAKYDKGASSAAAKEAEADYKNLLDAKTRLLEQQLAANIITFQEYSDKQKQIIEEYYRDGKIKAQDYYDALENMYSHRLSIYDKVTSAVTNRSDEELDRLKEQKEAVENSYQVKIDAIQSEIDALNKANDARKAQIDLEKAQYEAERARNQRVNKVFDGSQFIYSADTDAIRDAEDNLADKKLQSDISLLEGQIDSLKAEMENATKSLDLQIGALEAYKGKWNEISGVYEEQQNRLIAAEILGADWEMQILDGRLGILQSFTEQYIALQQAQADAAVNAARIKAEADAGNLTGGKVGNTPDTGGKNGDDNNSSTPPPNSGKWYIVNQATGEKLSRGFDSSREASKYLSSYAGTQSNHSVTLKKFHNGLDEGYVTVQGKSKPVNQSLELIKKLASDGVLPDEFPAILQHGELVLTPEQQQNMVNNARMAFFRSNGINLETDGYSAISHIQTSPQNVYNNISINCPNVTNNTGAEYILKSLQRLPLDTIQYTHRRQ